MAAMQRGLWSWWDTRRELFDFFLGVGWGMVESWEGGEKIWAMIYGLYYIFFVYCVGKGWRVVVL